MGYVRKMQSGNGIDLAAIYQLLSEVALTVKGHSQQFETMGRRFGALDSRLGEVIADIGGLREAVTHYHATVLGHGLMLSELDERLRPVERHLKLEPTGE